MGLINYKDIDFNKSINKENKIIEFNGNEIQVVNYLSIQDKYDFIMTTLKKSFDDGIYNEIRLRTYFDLHLVYVYTNIFFEVGERAAEGELYDIFKSSGLIDAVKEAIPQEEIDELWSMVRTMESKMTNYKGSLISLLSDLIEKLPEKAEKALTIVKEIDPEVLKTFSGGLGGLLGQFPPTFNQPAEL